MMQNDYPVTLVIENAKFGVRAVSGQATVLVEAWDHMIKSDVPRVEIGYGQSRLVMEGDEAAKFMDWLRKADRTVLVRKEYHREPPANPLFGTK